MAAGDATASDELRARPTIILASGSRTRAEMLERAGLTFERRPADVDEGAIKQAMAVDGKSADAIAGALAQAKAHAVSVQRRDALVIGADQILECEGRLFDKPPDLAAARGHIAALRGRTHQLVTGVCVLRNGECLWRHDERATLVMRAVSDAFVEGYLAAVGSDALSSVGAYQLEGRGAQLFERVTGDFFTILGLPLLPLLDFLRRYGALPK